MSHDPIYYAERADEERRLAMASASPKARALHLELAAKYAALAGANPQPVEEEQSVENEARKTA